MFSLLQVPPRPPGASASTVTGPPPAGIFLSLPLAKKPRNFPSADQKGNAAFSVPSNRAAIGLSRDCTYKAVGSFPERAEKATRVPSCEITGGPEKSPLNSNEVFGGGVRYPCTTRCVGCCRKA